MNMQQIDDDINSILNAAGSALQHYEQYSKDKMRAAMLDIHNRLIIKGANISINVVNNAINRIIKNENNQ